MSMYQTTAIENDTSATSRIQTNGAESTDSKPAITERQAQALEAVGMDASNVPTQFTAEQISCFVSILGQSRVDAIVAGATPTPAEFFQAKGCM